MNKWDNRYLELAALVSTWSKDPSTKVGAVIVGRRKTQIAVGYNGFPPGIEDSLERLNDREMKYSLIQHAERNVLDNVSFSPYGATLYATMFPCPQCALSIVSKGIKIVIAPHWECGPERWQLKSIQAYNILREAGISVVKVREQ